MAQLVRTPDLVSTGGPGFNPQCVHTLYYGVTRRFLIETMRHCISFVTKLQHHYEGLYLGWKAAPCDGGETIASKTPHDWAICWVTSETYQWAVFYIYSFQTDLDKWNA